MARVAKEAWIVGVQVGAEVVVLVPPCGQWRAAFEVNLLRWLAREHGWRTAPERYRVWRLSRPRSESDLRRGQAVPLADLTPAE